MQNVYPLAVTFVKTWKINKLSSLALLVIIWQTYDAAFSTNAFEQVKGSNIVFIVFVSAGLFLLFLSIAFVSGNLWLPKEDTISVCYCVPAKSPAMGVPLAQTMFIGLSPILSAKLQIPLVIFQGLQIAGGTIMIKPFLWWAAKEPKKVDNLDNEALQDDCSR